MCKLVFVLVMAALVAQGYSISQTKLDQLKALIAGLDTPAEPEPEPEPEPKAVPCVQEDPAPRTNNMVELEERLTNIEDEIGELIEYLSTEKLTDKPLKKKSDKVIAEMESKVQETDDVIAGLSEEVIGTLDDLEWMISEVNHSAQVTINSRGVIFYGRIGSPCSTYLDDCLDAHSVCRDGKCQCVPGYSFDVTNKECVENCAKYGPTYQTVSHHIIRGHNKHVLNGTDVDARRCKEWCNKDTNFLCKSIDFFPRWNLCFFSDVTMLEVEEEAVEYSSVGVHFQRDCV